MNKKSIYLATSVVAVIITASYVGLQSRTAQAQATPQEPKQIAQVVVKSVQQRPMSATLVTYGDVSAGNVKSISSASTASITALNVMQGSSVKKGEVLAVLGGDPMTRLAYEQAKTSVEQTKADFDRAIEMQAWKLATQAQVDAARKAKSDAEANLSAQRELGGDKGGQVIKAPADGVVLLLTASQGDRLQPGVPFMQIGTLETLKIMLGIDPTDLSAVRPGSSVKVVELGSDGSSVDAKVTEVHHVVDPKTQLASAMVKVPASANLTPGARVRADIVLPAQDVYEVPRQAVLSDAKGSYLFQISGNTAHRISVKKVVDSGQLVGVTGALDEKEPVVILGNYELTDGMTVRVSQ